MEIKRKVIMLPANKEVGLGGLYKCIYTVFDPEDMGKLVINVNNNVTKSNGYWEAQHLYLISDKEIKVGDFIIGMVSHLNQVYKVENITLNGNLLQLEPPCQMYPSHFKKVIASTDTSLNLPSIPQSFLQEYVDAQGKIEEVMLKAEILNNMAGKEMTMLWVNASDNTVIITPYKTTWTRDEVYDLCHDAFFDGYTYGINDTEKYKEKFVKWANQNFK